jgi:hypothetical protein
MLRWLRRRRLIAYQENEARAETAKPQRRAMSGEYVLLHKYLDGRYADTVVLTFAEIEDLLGFALPDEARLHAEWWTHPDTHVAGPNYSDSWMLANRTAAPNLPARIVVFEHVS